MAETVREVVGIAEMQKVEDQNAAENALREIPLAEQEKLVRAGTSLHLQQLRGKIEALNKGQMTIQDYLGELGKTRQALSTETSGDVAASNPSQAQAPTAAPSATSTALSPEMPAEPDGPGDGFLSILSSNPKTMESLKKLATIPFVGGLILTTFFSKKALAGFDIKVQDFDPTKLLQGLSKPRAQEITKESQAVLMKTFHLTERNTPEMLMLAEENTDHTPKLTVGKFLEGCPDHFDEKIWSDTAAELKSHGANTNDRRSVMVFVLNYLKNHSAWNGPETPTKKR